LLRAKAHAVEEKVENDLLPNWCRQRNLSCPGLLCKEENKESEG
jgi:hypothetical protein